MRVYYSLIFSALLALATPAFADAPPPTITITGQGRAEATPDMATLSLGVTSVADQAQTAMSENAAAMTSVIAALKAAGIEARDVQTSGLALQPNWTSSSLSSGNQIDGYTASNQLSVRVRDLSTLGTVIDAALTDGANTFNGVELGFLNPAPLLDEARKRAIADARHSAEIYAAAAGTKLGAIASITEGGTSPQPQGIAYARASMDSTPIETGEMSLTASVNVVWHLIPIN
jgi:uncharacterized protein YggE